MVLFAERRIAFHQRYFSYDGIHYFELIQVNNVARINGKFFLLA